MKKSFNKQLNRFIGLLTQSSERNHSALQTKSVKEQYRNIHYYLCSTKKWVTSVYSYKESTNNIGYRQHGSADKLLYTKSIITILLILVFIPLWLEWSISHFCILVLLTIGAIIILLALYNSCKKEIYYNGDMLALFTYYYLYLVETTIAHSSFNDIFSSINITIGLSMIILGLVNNTETVCIKEKLLFIIKNKEKFFIFVIAMLLVVFTLNFLLSLLGLAIIVESSSFTLFIYSLFAKIISLRLILIFVFCFINKRFKLDNLSLSLSSVVLIVLLGTLNYYYIMPYVKIVMLLGLRNLDYIFTRVNFWVESLTIKPNYTESLAEGIVNIITKLPIIGKYLYCFRTTRFNHDMLTPFRSSYSGILKSKSYTNLLPRISKFTNINIATLVDNKTEYTFSYKDSITKLKVLLKNNSAYLTDLISSFFYPYSNFSCKINFICADEVVILNTSFRGGHLEEFNLDRSNLNISNKNHEKPVSPIDSDYSNNKDEPFALIDPRNKDMLQPTDFKKGGFNPKSFTGDCSINKDEPFALIDPSKKYLLRETDPKNLGFCTKPQIFTLGGISYDIYNNYPCIYTEMTRFEDRDFLSLRFDSEKFITERDTYLNEIYYKGRTLLFNHYSNIIGNNMEIYGIIDNFPFEQISISDNTDTGYLNFYNAFFAKNKHIIERFNIKFNQTYPFSTLYMDGNVNYSQGSAAHPLIVDHTQVERAALGNYSQGSTAYPATQDHIQVEGMALSNYSQGYGTDPAILDHTQVEGMALSNYSQGSTAYPATQDHIQVEGMALSNYSQGYGTDLALLGDTQVEGMALSNYSQGYGMALSNYSQGYGTDLALLDDTQVEGIALNNYSQGYGTDLAIQDDTQVEGIDLNNYSQGYGTDPAIQDPAIQDDTQVERVVLGNLEVRKINDLISWLDRKQREHFNNRRSNRTVYCKLRDAGIIFRRGSFTTRGGDNETTDMLNRLRLLKPSWFKYSLVSHDIVRVTARDISSKLKKLIE